MPLVQSGRLLIAVGPVGRLLESVGRLLSAVGPVSTEVVECRWSSQ